MIVMGLLGSGCVRFGGVPFSCCCCFLGPEEAEESGSSIRRRFEECAGSGDAERDWGGDGGRVGDRGRGRSFNS